MGIGREVADAYISVHGDLSDFRKDLEKANEGIEKLARQQAKEYGDAFNEQIQRDIKGKWADMVQTMFNGDKMDFSRLVERFDPDSLGLDEATLRITDFMDKMREAGKLTNEEFDTTQKAILDHIGSMREEQRVSEELLTVRNDLAEMQERQNKALAERSSIMDEAIKDNKEWARTFEGMRTNKAIHGAIKDMEDDFRSLADVMTSADVGKFMKGFDSMGEMSARVREVTDEMSRQNRISDESAMQLRQHVNEFMAGERDRLAILEERGRIEAENARLDLEAQGRALDAARELREEQERYNRSLEGMLRAAQVGRLERDFRNLAMAIESNDWSNIARGHQNMAEMRDRTAEVAAEMHRLGRITDDDFRNISQRLTDVETHARNFNVHFRETNELSGSIRERIGDSLARIINNSNSTRGWAGHARTLASRFAGTVSHLKGLAGLNVFGDMIRNGLHFAQNVDRMALSIGNVALKIGTAASIIATAVGGMVVVAGDLAAAGNIAILAPAFLTGLGIQVGVVVAAFKDLKTVLKDLGPQFSNLQTAISGRFWEQAEQPIRNLTDSLFPTLATQMENTATSMGNMFGALADGFRKNATPARVEGMFKKMNAAIDIATGAMGPLSSAFTTLGEHGSNYFGRFATWIKDLSTRFDNFISKAAKDGRLKKWTEEAIDAFKNTGRSIGGITEIFQGIGWAAKAAGIGGLKEFADSMERGADAVKSEAFQSTLTTFFEGTASLTRQVGQGIRDLGPAMESIMPSVKYVLDNMGTAVNDLIGYLGTVLADPDFQKGLRDFSQGIESAVKKLEPAIGPLADSLGNMATIIGDEILPNIADIVTAFTVNLSPVIDDIGNKMAELATPLKNTVTTAIEQLKPVFESLKTTVIDPLVDGIKTYLLPAVDDFIKKAGGPLKKLGEDVGPVFKTLAETTLPAMVKFAGELIEPLGKVIGLLTPAAAGVAKDLGAGFSQMAEGLKALKGESNNFKWGLPDVPSQEELHKDLRASWGKDSNNNFWSDLEDVIFGGEGQSDDFGQRFLEAWSDDLSDFIPEVDKHLANFHKDFNEVGNDFIADLPSLGTKIGDGWNRVWSGNIFGDQPGKWLGEAAENVGKDFENFGKDFEKNAMTAAGGWEGMWKDFFDPIKKGISEAWDKMWKDLGDWWEDAKSNFQDFMSDILGFNTHPGDEASVSGGMGSMGVGGKITPEMIGLGTPEEGWLQGTIDAVSTAVSDFFTGVGEDFTTFGEDVKTGWDEFWGGFGTIVSDTWTNITTFLSTKWTEITTNISIWWEGIKTGWNDFWGSLPTKVSEVWTTVTTWISTKAGEIKTNIDTFITNVRTNWDNFWNTVNTKVQTIWTTVTTWISTKVGEIRTNIDNFVTTVRTNWDNFWNTVNQKVQTIWSTITGWIGTKAAEIRGKIDGFISTVKTNWDNFWNTVKTKVDEIWRTITTTISQKIEDVKTFFRNLPGDLVTAMGDIWGKFSAVGEDIANGLKNGIDAGIQWVKDAAANIADAAIKAAKAVLDQHSPSRVFHAIGLFNGLGMANGMAESESTVSAAAANMADVAIAAVTTSKMYAAGASAALGLAEGLKSQRSTIASALETLLPPSTALGVNVTGTGGVGGSTPVGNTTIINVAEGAIPITTPTQNPDIVAAKVIDGFANFSNA